MATALLGAMAAQAQIDFDKLERDNQTKLLKGLAGFNPRYVSVQGGDVKDDPNVYTTEELHTLVELCLRRNGVKVLTFDLESLRSNDPSVTEKLKAYNATPKANLDVQFTCLKIENGAYVYSFSLKVNELAALKRDANLYVNGELYARSVVGVAGRSTIKSAMRELVEKNLDELCNLFLKANEK